MNCRSRKMLMANANKIRLTSISLRLRLKTIFECPGHLSVKFEIKSGPRKTAAATKIASLHVKTELHRSHGRQSVKSS